MEAAALLAGVRVGVGNQDEGRRPPVGSQQLLQALAERGEAELVLRQPRHVAVELENEADLAAHDVVVARNGSSTKLCIQIS